MVSNRQVHASQKSLLQALIGLSWFFQMSGFDLDSLISRVGKEKLIKPRR